MREPVRSVRSTRSAGGRGRPRHDRVVALERTALRGHDGRSASGAARHACDCDKVPQILYVCILESRQNDTLT